MPSRNLTVAAVERLKPPKAGQLDYFDGGYPGLLLRVSYGGAKAWSYIYRLHGKQRRLTLGRWPAMTLAEARAAWRAAHALVSRGENPSGIRPAAADTFGAVLAEWLKRDQSGNRTALEVRKSIERTVLPRWRDRMIATIARRDVIEAIDKVADRGTPIAARRLHAHLHRLFRWSVGRGIVAVNPMADLPKPGAETTRERVLTDAEWPWCGRRLKKSAGRSDRCSSCCFSPALAAMRSAHFVGQRFRIARSSSQASAPRTASLAQSRWRRPRLRSSGTCLISATATTCSRRRATRLFPVGRRRKSCSMAQRWKSMAAEH
jgi:hypothetical protein